jgi:hypothetical protein
MRTTFWALFQFISFLVLAQTPPLNDECNQAIELAVHSNQVLETFDLTNATLNPLSIPTGYSCLPYSSSADVWFKFMATEPYLRFRFQANSQVIRARIVADCDSSVTHSCMYNNMINGPFEIGRTYFIQVSRIGYQVVPSLTFKIGIQETGLGPYIKSSETGGDWSNESTWLSNQVPGQEDTVEIAEGARVNFYSSYGEPMCKYLRIGGRDNTRKSVLSGFSSFTSNGGIYLGEGDSLIGNQGLRLKIGDSCRLDGSFLATHLGLTFTGNHAYDFKGSGNFLIERFNGIDNSNKAEIRLKFGGDLYGGLKLSAGNLKFLQPVKFKLLSGGFPNYIEINQGKYEGPFQIEIPPNFAEEQGFIDYTYGVPYLWGSGVFDSNLVFDPQWDTISKPGREFLNANIMRKMTINKPNGNRPFGFDSTLNFASFFVGSGKVRMKNPNDTIFAHLIDFRATPDTSLKALRNLCLYQNPAYGNLEDQVGQWNTYGVTTNGKYRNLNISGVWNTEPGQKICPEVVPAKPIGLVNLPLTKLLGASSVKVNYSKPIPGGNLRIYLVPNPMDSLFVPGEELVLAQASNPTGPWTKISTNPLYSQIYSASSNPLFFENGQYFCFSTTAKRNNMALHSIIPPLKYYETGCLLSPSHPVGVVVRNYGYEKADQFEVFYRVNSGPVKSLQVQYPANKELKGGLRDTIWFTGISGLTISTPGVYSIQAWVKQIGDTVLQNDSLSYSYDAIPWPLPYDNTFDTIAATFFSNSIRKIPYRWFDPVYYQKLENLRAENIPFDYNNYFYISSSAGTQKFLNGSFERPSFHSIYTHPIGPLPATSVLALKYEIPYFSVSQPAALQPGDSVFVEASSDCGLNWIPIFKMYKENLPLTSGMTLIKDSLPFGEGSIISLRFRTHLPPSNFTLPVYIRFDSLQIVGGILASNKYNLNTSPKPLLFPNPASYKIKVESQSIGSKPFGYRLQDVRGRLVQQGRLENGEIRLQPGIPNGLYHLQLISDNEIWNDRILIDQKD